MGKGREIGGTSEDRDSVVQFGSPLARAPPGRVLTRLEPVLQFGICRGWDILKPNLISASFGHTFPSSTNVFRMFLTRWEVEN